MRAHFVIFADDPPRLGQIRAGDSEVFPVSLANQATTDVSERAKAIATVLKERGYDGSGVMLAIPSQWCLCAAISIADLPKRNRRQLMIYRLEEHLPMAAEELVIDFGLAGERALGICALVSRLQPWVGALERLGVAVQSVVPIALLAAKMVDIRLADVLLLGNDKGTDVLTFARGQIVGWSTELDIEGVGVQLRRLSLLSERLLSVVAYGLDDRAVGELSDLTQIEIAGNKTNDGQGARDEDIYLAALGGALPILLGEKPPPIELRRDALAQAHPFRQIRRPLTCVVAATILFSLSLAGSLLVRAHTYRLQGLAAESIERSSYQDALGRPPNGANIQARLISEDRKLAALSGVLDNDRSADAFDLHRSRSALLLLSDTLKALPRNLRYRLLDLQFTPEGLELNGQTRTHGDADAIAVGLRSVGYAVDPPHSEVRGQDKGVNFTITARAVEPSNIQQGIP
jgi:hypothetical protein